MAKTSIGALEVELALSGIGSYWVVAKCSGIRAHSQVIRLIERSTEWPGEFYYVVIHSWWRKGVRYGSEARVYTPVGPEHLYRYGRRVTPEEAEKFLHPEWSGEANNG